MVLANPEINTIFLLPCWSGRDGMMGAPGQKGADGQNGGKAGFGVKFRISESRFNCENEGAGEVERD